jgi:hypothetical protein
MLWFLKALWWIVSGSVLASWGIVPWSAEIGFVLWVIVMVFYVADWYADRHCPLPDSPAFPWERHLIDEPPPSDLLAPPEGMALLAPTDAAAAPAPAPVPAAHSPDAD